MNQFNTTKVKDHAGSTGGAAGAWRFAATSEPAPDPEQQALALQVYARWLIRAARSASISDRSMQSDAPALTSATPDCTVGSTLNGSPK